MTATDSTAFFEVFSKVARTFGRKPDAETCGVYFEALEAVTLDEIESAATALVKSSRYFPKPVDWLEAAHRERKPARFEKFSPPIVTPDGTTETVYHCHWCKDSGWRPGCGCELGRLDLTWKCPHHVYERYGLKYPEPVKPCSCRGANPVWLSNHQVKFATTQEDWRS